MTADYSHPTFSIKTCQYYVLFHKNNKTNSQLDQTKCLTDTKYDPYKVKRLNDLSY